jgi:surface protein
MPRLASITSQTLAGLGLSRGIAELINGDFQTGDFTGWSATNFDILEVNSGVARVSSSGLGTLAQGLSVIPNTNYVLAFNVVNASATGGANVTLSSATNGNLVLESLTSSSGLQAFAFTTQDNAVALEFTTQNNGELQLDNIVIAPLNSYFTYEYQLSNTATDPTSTTWRTSFAPADTFFFPNIGMYSLTPITDATQMFQSSTVNDEDIANWDTSSFTITDSMFEGTANFNVNISEWDMSSVTDTSSMFANAVSFNQPIGSWDTSNVTIMNNMFNDADAFDQDISTWNTSSVTSATNFSANADQKINSNWTDQEHPKLAIRNTGGTALSAFGSTTTSVTLEDAATGLPGFPFRVYGENSGTIAEVSSTGTAGFGETILNFSAAVTNTWEFGERVSVLTSSI